MIQWLNPYGPTIERVLMLLTIIVVAIAIGIILGVIALKVLPPHSEMRVLSSYEAVDRGWAMQFEE